VDEPVAQALGLCAGELAGEQQRLRPGDQVVGDQHEAEPDAVVLEVAEGQVGKTRVLVVADVVLDVRAGAVAALDDGELGVGLVGEDRLEAVTVVVGERQLRGAGARGARSPASPRASP